MGRANDSSAPRVRASSINAREKERQAISLRLTGATLWQIAQALGYNNESSVRSAIERGLNRAVAEPADKMRALELERLDRMLHAIWPTAINGPTQERLQAIDRILKIMDRRAKLMGLDAPLRVDYRRMVRNVALELGLSDDERKELDRDVSRFLDEIAAEKPAFGL